MQSRIARGAQGHHLHDGDGNVGVGRGGCVAPSTRVVLAADDEIHRALERRANSLVGSGSPELGKRQSRHSVAVHVAATAAPGTDKQTVRLA